ALGGLAVCGLWWTDPASAAITSPGAALTAAGRVAGLVGAYLALVQLLLLARLPWLERAVGFDRLAAWHRGLGTNVVLVLVTHVLLVVAGLGMTERHAPWSAAIEIITTYPDMITALAGMALFLTVAVTSARFARARMSYEAWYLVHIGAYLAIALAFFHQISSGADFVTDPKARALWVALYAAVAGSVLWWRVAVPTRRWFRHAITVDKVVRETPNTVSVWLHGRNLDELGVQPGQFLLWRFVTVGHRWSAHPYSLSAPVNRHRMRITVKDAGDHSRALARLRRGTPVFAEGPFGHFTADARRREPVLLIAGGSGIGPIRALAEQLLRERVDVLLLYRVSELRDVAFRSELDAMTRSGLTVRYLVGRRAELRGDPLAPSALRRLAPDLTTRSVYVCGPAGMTATVLGSLTRLGVPAQHIHTEEFSLR
ncbi:MAG TPA: ferric reductase-like transmembrane domain-containing protein, partial [Pseudonocardiaceae bacterium]|nr:ferric reductase-like transmembrane domain-containing protein [Pseudonocardiaceae bacterium]